MSRAPVVGVMGGGLASAETLELARELGREIAGAGWILLNGGRDAGVMAASARGARESSGLVVGILPGPDPSGASPDLTIAVVTGLGNARNVINVLSSDVIVALPGGAGTLSEIALARKSGKPVVLLRWPEGTLPELSGDALARTSTVAEAMHAVRRYLDETGAQSPPRSPRQ